MRRWMLGVAFVIVALVAASFVAFRVLTTAPVDLPQGDPSSSVTPGADVGAERVRSRVAGADPRAAPGPAEQTPAVDEPIASPPTPSQDSDDASIGTLVATDSRTGQPLAGVEIALIDAKTLREHPDASHSGDAFALARRIGRVIRTDAEGRIGVPPFRGRVTAFVDQGGLAGRMSLDLSEAPEWTFSVQPVRRIDVRVEDEAGRSVAGVPVALRRSPLPGHGWIIASARTDASGEATIQAVGTDAALADRPLTVSPLLPLVDLPSASVDWAELPSERVDLVLPASGSLRVELVDEQGARWTRAATVTLSGAPGTPDGERRLRTLVQKAAVDGIVAFPHVEVGVDVKLTVTSHDGARDPASVVVAGPERIGEAIVHRVAVGRARPQISMQLVDGNGVPVGGYAVVVQAQTPGGGFVRPPRREDSVVSDPEGWVHVSVAGTAADPGAVAILVGDYVSTGPGRWHSRSLATVKTAALRTDRPTVLGKVTIDPERPLVAGVVVVSDGAPLVGAKVARMRARHGGRSPVRDVPTVETDAEGRFVLVGPAGDGSVMLGVSHPAHYLSDPPDVAVGSSDVRIEMQPAGKLVVTIAEFAGVAADRVRVRVTGPAIDNGGTGYRLPGSGVTVRGQDGAYVLEGLRPGLADVRVVVGQPARDELLHVPDAVVPERDGPQDERLQAIDLSTLVTTTEVVVLDTNRQPIRGATVAVRTEQNPRTWQQMYANKSGVVVVRVVGQPLAMLATAPGHAFVDVPAGVARATVVLRERASTDVTLHLHESTALPAPPMQLAATVRYLGPVGGTERRQSMRSDPRDPTLTGLRDKAFSKERTVTIPVRSPGRYLVSFMLMKQHMGGGGGSGVRARTESGIVVVPGDGRPVTAVVAPDPEELELVRSRLETSR